MTDTFSKRTKSQSCRPESGAVLLEAWEATVRRRAGDRAVVEAGSGRTCTFAELNDRADAWLTTHTRNGVHRLAGRAVVFAVPNGIGWLEILIALLRAGAVAVPVDAAEPVPAQQRVAERLRAGFWWDGTKLIPLLRPRTFRDPMARLIKLTSGSTGEPRPLLFNEAQLLADARQVTRSMGITAADLNYAIIPFGHSYGLGNLSIPLVARGVPVVCGSAALPQSIADDFRRWRPTVLPAVPALFRALVASGLESSALASLRLAISAGAPLAPEAAREFYARFGRRLHGFYGSSETGGIAFDRTGSATLQGGVGTAMHGVTITPLAAGRLRIGSAAVFTAKNRHRSKGLGCWVPPDRAQVDGRGRITLLGRTGTTVKIAGRRVNLTEVANRLRRILGVTDVWVGTGGSPEPILGAAVVTSRSIPDLRAELLADTPAWRIPKRWAVLPAMPLSGRGKIDSRALQAKVFG